LLLSIFADAICVVHVLDTLYLWIQLFCVIQDDEVDWAVELSKMASVYNTIIYTHTQPDVQCF